MVSVGASIGITMRANFGMKWLQVAAAHHHTAKDARDRLDAAERVGRDIGQALDDELQTTMVVVAAAAFSIDALFVKLEELAA